MPQATNDVFVPDIWNVGLEKALYNALIYSKWTNRDYEGVLEKPGDQVRIMAAGNVEVKKLDYSKEEDRKKFENDLGEPQSMTGSGITLQVNQIAYYIIQDSDLNKKLRNKDLWGHYQEDAAVQTKSEIDSYLAGFATKFPYFESSKTAPIELNVNNICKTLTKMNTVIHKNNVNAELKMEVPFEFLDILVEAYESSQANNAEYMKKGKITSAENSGVYHNMIFEASNNVHSETVSGTTVYTCMLRTKRALAYVNRCGFSEKLRSTTGFSDILRGYTLYDAKVIFPKEGLAIRFKVDVDAQKYVLTKAQA
ncbi:MAG TPA: hypothetical protein PKV66_01660 [Candidatus Pelethenecus sp.]|nr:hypothetical protein [Candidatus Pelethenecus sp.]